MYLIDSDGSKEFNITFNENATATAEDLPYSVYTVKYGSGILSSRVEVNESAVSQTIYTNEIMISYTIKAHVYDKNTSLPISGVSVNIF